jgi:CHASE3 domain sensor protein
MQRISTPRADILPAILIAVVPLAFLAAISLYQVFGNTTDARLVHEKILNSFFVVRTASDLCGEIQSAERGQRGYLITGRDEYLAPYEKAKKRIPQLLNDLQQATLETPDQQRRLLQLQADLTTKLNELATTITLRREKVSMRLWPS